MSTPLQSHLSIEKRDTEAIQEVSPTISVLEAPIVRQWPREWKAYAALVAGFFMMFNCW